MPINKLQKTEVFFLALADMQELLRVDPEAVSALINYSVPCNERVETNSVAIPKEIDGQLHIGPLGLLNGILNSLTGLRLAAVKNEDGKIVDFVQYAESNS